MFKDFHINTDFYQHKMGSTENRRREFSAPPPLSLFLSLSLYIYIYLHIFKEALRTIFSSNG